MNEYNRTHPTSICKECGTERYRFKKCEVCFPGALRAATNERRRQLRKALGKYRTRPPHVQGLRYRVARPKCEADLLRRLQAGSRPKTYGSASGLLQVR